MFEARASGLERGDDRLELGADAPHYRVGAVGAGIFGRVEDEPGGARPVDQHAFGRPFVGELQPERFAIKGAGAREVGDGDDGGGSMVLQHRIFSWSVGRLRGTLGGSVPIPLLRL